MSSLLIVVGSRPAKQEILKPLTDPADIEANRRGQITPLQMMALQQQPASNPVAIFLMIFLPLFMLFGMLLPLFLSPETVYFVCLASSITLIGGVAGLAQFRNQRHKARIQKDLTDKIIHQAEGHLVFGRRGYQIHLPGRRVAVPRGRGNLLPGVIYRFYYLPETGFVLSAEPLSPLDEEQVKESLLKTLARVNRFSLAALETNRCRQLTVRQILTRLSVLWPSLVLFLGAGYLSFRIYQIQFASYPEPAMRPVHLPEAFIFASMLPLLPIIGGVWVALEGFKRSKARRQGRRDRPKLSPLPWPILSISLFLLAGYLSSRLHSLLNSGPLPESSLRSLSILFESLVVLLLIIGAGWVAYRVVAELWAGQVASVAGVGFGHSVRTTHTNTDEEGRTRTRTKTVYYYSVDKQSFKVSRRAYQALIDGLRYRLYYLPHSRTMVNIEPLGG